MATLLPPPLAIRAETVERLQAVAKLVGRDPLLIATEGIERMLDDLEDYHIAEQRIREAEPGTAVPIEVLMTKYGIDA